MRVVLVSLGLPSYAIFCISNIDFFGGCQNLKSSETSFYERYLKTEDIGYFLVSISNTQHKLHLRFQKNFGKVKPNCTHCTQPGKSIPFCKQNESMFMYTFTTLQDTFFLSNNIRSCNDSLLLQPKPISNICSTNYLIKKFYKTVY